MPSSGGALGFDGEKSAAAARPRYARSTVREELTAL